MLEKEKGKVILGENMDVLKNFEDGSISFIYIDPPFNTGKVQSRKRMKTTRSEDGDRVGFQGIKYKTTVLSNMGYDDSFGDYLQFIKPRLQRAYELLKSNGSLFFHIDYREAHYCKILLDNIFGRECFLNEIIWSYDFGARTRKKWSAKHDTIFWYCKDPDNYIFNYDEVDRIPYMAPSLVGKEKAEKGKTPTDVWWNTIVPTNGKERTGYPTQKPLAIIKRILATSSNEGDTVMDFFAGSGTLGEAAAMLNRKFVLIDRNQEAYNVMQKRFKGFDNVVFEDQSLIAKKNAFKIV